MGSPLLFFGSERVCTETTSEQPTGHSGLTSKAEEEGFKVSYIAFRVFSACNSTQTVHLQMKLWSSRNGIVQL